MKLEYDQPKADKTWNERRLRFSRAGEVFAGKVVQQEDDRKNYGEIRMQTIGRYGRKIVMVVWTPRGEARRIISMRECNHEERELYHAQVG